MVEKLSYDSKLSRETDASFQKFLVYRNLPPHQRSIRKVAQKISENPQDVEKTYRSLKKLSSNWQWVERCKLYDADLQLKLVRKRADKFDEFNDILIDNTDGLIRYVNNLLGEVLKNSIKENGERYSLASRIKMAKDMSNILKELNELGCNITGRPHEYTEMNVNTNVSEQTINFVEKMKKRRETEKDES